MRAIAPVIRGASGATSSASWLLAPMKMIGPERTKKKFWIAGTAG